MSATGPTVRVELELGQAEAWALAEFIKRALWDDYRRRAINELEAQQMRAAAEAIGRALAEVGVAPR